MQANLLAEIGFTTAKKEELESNLSALVPAQLYQVPDFSMKRRP